MLFNKHQGIFMTEALGATLLALPMNSYLFGIHKYLSPLFFVVKKILFSRLIVELHLF